MFVTFYIFIYLLHGSLWILCDVRCQQHVYVYVVYLGLCVVFDRYQRRISGEKL